MNHRSSYFATFPGDVPPGFPQDRTTRVKHVFAFACTNQPIVTLVVKKCLIKIPVCGGVACDPCVGVGEGVEVGRTTDVELPSGKPVED